MKGIIAVNDRHGFIVVAFQGSHNVVNWINNVRFGKVSPDFGPSLDLMVF